MNTAVLNELTIAGIPADVLAHVTIGALLFGFFRIARFSLSFAALIVVAFAVQKEFLDWNNLGGNGCIFEALKDVGFSLAGGFSAMLTMRAGSRTRDAAPASAGVDARVTPLVIIDKNAKARAAAILSLLTKKRWP